MSGKPTINPIKQATDALNQNGQTVTEELNGIGTNQGDIRAQLENSINVGKTTPKTSNRASSLTKALPLYPLQELVEIVLECSRNNKHSIYS